MCLRAQGSSGVYVTVFIVLPNGSREQLLDFGPSLTYSREPVYQFDGEVLLFSSEYGSSVAALSPNKISDQERDVIETAAARAVSENGQANPVTLDLETVVRGTVFVQRVQVSRPRGQTFIRPITQVARSRTSVTAQATEADTRIARQYVCSYKSKSERLPSWLAPLSLKNRPEVSYPKVFFLKMKIFNSQFCVADCDRVMTSGTSFDFRNRIVSLSPSVGDNAVAQQYIDWVYEFDTELGTLEIFDRWVRGRTMQRRIGLVGTLSCKPEPFTRMPEP